MDCNSIGDAGLAALSPALRQLPKLKKLSIDGNQITDQGLASLMESLTSPTPFLLTSLQFLDLDDNQITDEGCAALASALRGGALPALGDLDLGGNPASEAAAKAVLPAH